MKFILFFLFVYQIYSLSYRSHSYNLLLIQNDTCYVVYDNAHSFNGFSLVDDEIRKRCKTTIVDSVPHISYNGGGLDYIKKIDCY